MRYAVTATVTIPVYVKVDADRHSAKTVRW